MTIKLNKWQTLGLFLPFLIGSIILNLPHQDLYAYETNLAIANLLFLINVCIVICYQGYLALGFNNTSGIKSVGFKLNALVPIVFTVLYLFFVIYLTIWRHNVHNPKYTPGPITQVKYGLTTWITLLLFLHAFITFYFINNQFVSSKIKKVLDEPFQERLKADFLVPMKRLVKFSIWGIGVFLLLSVVADLVKFWKID